MDGAFMIGFAMLATLPLSLGVMEAYSAMASAQGVPVADQDFGLWTLAAFAVCAVVNALLFWVVFRGRRIRADRAEPA